MRFVGLSQQLRWKGLCMSYRQLLHTLLLASFSSILGFCAPAQAREGSFDDVGAIYTMSNDTGANSVLVFQRKASGELVANGSVPTGGRGLGAGLGNQGALALSDDGHWLAVVNPGSDDVTIFDVGDNGLRAVSRTSSGGQRPVSISIDGDLVYVLNAQSDSIAGFRLNERGRLVALPSSVRPLSGSGVGAAQIGISRGARSVIVTEKATNRLTVYPLDYAGRPAAHPQIVASPGPTPFGFTFTRRRTLLVAEAAPGVPGGASVSSYRVDVNGVPTVLERSVPTRQTAACWITTTPGGQFAYTANTGGNSLSGFALGRHGDLALLNANGVAASVPNAGPIDVTIVDEGRYLYVLEGASHTVGLFRIGNDGALTAGASLSGLPSAANGLVGR
jgi:6-phosphogluconolactonase